MQSIKLLDFFWCAGNLNVPNMTPIKEVLLKVCKVSGIRGKIHAPCVLAQEEIALIAFLIRKVHYSQEYNLRQADCQKENMLNQFIRQRASSISKTVKNNLDLVQSCYNQFATKSTIGIKGYMKLKCKEVEEIKMQRMFSFSSG